MASPIAWTDVTAVGNNDPVLINYPAAGQTAVLAYVNSVLDVNMFDGEAGARTKLARCFLAAHIAACSALGDAGGPVASESEGGVSRSYAVYLTANIYLSTTWGKMYWMMIGPQAFGPRLL